MVHTADFQTMPAYRFATLLWQDAAGFFTAVPVEAPDDQAAGFARSATAALQQLRDYLSWLYRQEPDREGPSLVPASLQTFKVMVRPEYQVGDRVYACTDALELRVHCVAGRLSSGLRVAVLPLIGVRFYYHEEDALKELVRRYTQLALRGREPRQLSRYLPPPVVRTEEVVITVRRRERKPQPQAHLPHLSQVAEPLGKRAARRQLSAAWEREALVAKAVRKLHAEKTSLLLVGEPGAGKTTVLAEAVQMAERQHAEEAQLRGDEAAPEVFDVLLGVCDEGRLTDRYGRTTTFRSSVVVMTSNLGTDRAGAFGFGNTAAAP
jgi:ATP-dependent Clp protease ATP-binding subunit ClpC